MTHLSIDSLREQLMALRTEKKRCCQEISRLDAEIDELQARFNEQTGEMANRVTDHAVVRYLERKMGINMVELKEMLIRDHIHKARTVMKFQVKTIHGELVFKNGMLVTIT